MDALKRKALLSAVEMVAPPVISSFKITGCAQSLSSRKVGISHQQESCGNGLTEGWETLPDSF